jgi:CIC family chloride channel protein
MAPQTWQARLRLSLISLTGQFWSSETTVMLTLALIVGLGTGLGTVILVRLIAFVTKLVVAGGEQVPRSMGSPYVILIPSLGALCAGVLLRLFSAPTAGLDVSDVVSAIATQSGRIRPLNALARALAAVLTIGAGGSAGRESPLVEIGSALGSAVGRAFHLSEWRTVHLVAAGGAAAIAATFNAPLAGLMFALEVLLGGFNLQSFAPLVVSAASATIASRLFLGATPAFAVRSYALQSGWELVLFTVLGVVCALAAAAFCRLLFLVEEGFALLKLPPFARMALAGLVVGLIGLHLPQVFGMGFDGTGQALQGDLALHILLALLLAKAIATSFTLGSSAGGGVFAPLLFLGAMLGGAYGSAAHAALPGLVAAGGGAYAVVGMAALLGAATRAPVTAVLLVFELSQDVRLIIPVALATVISAALANKVKAASIYGQELERHGLAARPRRDADVLQSIVVEEAMTGADELQTVSPEMKLSELARLFRTTAHHGFVVLDERQELYGVVTLSDVEHAIETGKARGTVADICTHNVSTVYADETLDDALRHFAALDVGRIPVIARSNPRHVIGLLRRGDIVRAYARALSEAPTDEELAKRAALQSAAGAEVAEFVLSESDATVGRRLHEVDLPEDCVVISIHRRGRVVVPRGNTQLLAGDRVIILKVATAAETLRQILHEGGQPT